MEKKDKPSTKSNQPAPTAPDIELLPDAWERFEKAVDRVAKSPPQPRTSKPTGRQRMAKSNKPGG